METVLEFVMDCKTEELKIIQTKWKESALITILKFKGFRFSRQSKISYNQRGKSLVAVIEKSYWTDNLRRVQDLPINWRIITDEVVKSVFNKKNEAWNKSNQLKTLELTGYTFQQISEDDDVRRCILLHNAICEPWSSTAIPTKDHWYVQPTVIGDRKGTLRLLQLRNAGVTQITNHTFKDYLFMGWNPNPKSCIADLFQGLSFFLLIPDETMRGLIIENGGRVIDEVINGCVILYSEETLASIDPCVKLGLVNSRFVYLSVEWIRARTCFAKDVALDHPLEEYVRDFLDVPHPSKFPKPHLFRYAIFEDKGSWSNENSEELGDLCYTPPEGIDERAVKEKLAKCNVQKTCRFYDCHVLICGDTVTQDPSTFIGKHAVRFRCIEEIIDSKTGHTCDWDHKPILMNQKQGALEGKRFHVVVPPTKTSLITNAILLAGGRIKKDGKLDAGDIVIGENDAVVEFDKSVDVLINRAIMIIRPQSLIDYFKTGASQLEDFGISAKERVSWKNCDLGASTFSFNSSDPTVQSPEIQASPINEELMETSQENCLDVAGKTNCMEYGNTPMDTSQEYEQDYQLNNVGKIASKAHQYLTDTSAIRTAEFMKEKMLALGLTIGHVAISYKGNYPLENVEDLVPYVEPIFLSHVKNNSGLVECFADSSIEKRIVLAGVFKSNVSSQKDWMEVTGRLIKCTLNSFGLGAKERKSGENQIEIICSPAINEQPVVFMTFTMHEDTSEDSCITFASTIKNFGFLNDCIKHSSVAHPQVYLICDASCICEAKLKIHTELVVGKREPIRCFCIHEESEYLELGTPLIIRCERDYYNYTVRANPTIEGQVRDLNYETIRALLFRCDEELKNASFHL